MIFLLINISFWLSHEEKKHVFLIGGFTLKKKKTTSKKPHPDTLFWHGFRHTIWKILELYIYIWHIHSDILTLFLAYTLTFYPTFSPEFYLTFVLTYTLTFYPTFFLAVVYLTYFLASILTFFPAFYLASILTFFLAFYLTYVLTSQSLWHRF